LTVLNTPRAGQADSDEKYINKTFTLASPNLSINGLPVTADAFLGGAPTAPDTTYEPFDARKRQRVADLITQEEKLLEEVASLKRAVPSRAAAAHAEKLRDGLKADEDVLTELRGEVEAEAAAPPEGRPWLQGAGPLERQEDVERGYRGAVQVLARLKTDMAAMLAKMERARVAGEYVVAEGR
jgi:kinetochor protein Mis14/NSL1